jgi:hypothetical protein
MQGVLNAAKKFVDVLTGDEQSPLLRLVQFAWASCLYDLEFCFGHDSSKCCWLLRSHLP